MLGNETAYDFLSYVWSNIFDLRINVAGDEEAGGDMLVRGTLGEPPFSLLYVLDHQLTSCFTVNAKGIEFSTMKKLIEQQTDLSGLEDQLADPASDLREL